MLSGLLAGSTALMIAVKNWKFIRWRMMWIVTFFNVLFSFVATEYMRSLSNDVLKQCVSGVMGGMFAMPGPPVVLYCISTLEDKKEYVATLQAFSVVFNSFYTIFRFNAGFYSENTWLWWIMGIGGAVIGSLLGSRCFELISNQTLKRIVYVMMIVSGMIAFFK